MKQCNKITHNKKPTRCQTHTEIRKSPLICEMKWWLTPKQTVQQRNTQSLDIQTVNIGYFYISEDIFGSFVPFVYNILR